MRCIYLLEASDKGMISDDVCVSFALTHFVYLSVGMM